MNRFWKQLEKSTIVTGLISLVLVTTASYCVISGIEMPEYLALAVTVVIAYYFTRRARKENGAA